MKNKFKNFLFYILILLFPLIFSSCSSGLTEKEEISIYLEFLSQNDFNTEKILGSYLHDVKKYKLQLYKDDFINSFKDNFELYDSLKNDKYFDFYNEIIYEIDEKTFNCNKFFIFKDKNLDFNCKNPDDLLNFIQNDLNLKNSFNSNEFVLKKIKSEKINRTDFSSEDPLVSIIKPIELLFNSSFKNAGETKDILYDFAYFMRLTGEFNEENYLSYVSSLFTDLNSDYKPFGIENVKKIPIYVQEIQGDGRRFNINDKRIADFGMDVDSVKQYVSTIQSAIGLLPKEYGQFVNKIIINNDKIAVGGYNPILRDYNNDKGKIAAVELSDNEIDVNLIKEKIKEKFLSDDSSFSTYNSFEEVREFFDLINYKDLFLSNLGAELLKDGRFTIDIQNQSNVNISTILKMNPEANEFYKKHEDKFGYDILSITKDIVSPVIQEFSDELFKKHSNKITDNIEDFIKKELKDKELSMDLWLNGRMQSFESILFHEVVGHGGGLIDFEKDLKNGGVKNPSNLNSFADDTYSLGDSKLFEKIIKDYNFVNGGKGEWATDELKKRYSDSFFQLFDDYGLSNQSEFMARIMEYSVYNPYFFYYTYKMHPENGFIQDYYPLIKEELINRGIFTQDGMQKLELRIDGIINDSFSGKYTTNEIVEKYGLKNITPDSDKIRYINAKNVIN